MVQTRTILPHVNRTGWKCGGCEREYEYIGVWGALAVAMSSYMCECVCEYMCLSVSSAPRILFILNSRGYSIISEGKTKRHPLAFAGSTTRRIYQRYLPPFLLYPPLHCRATVFVGPRRNSHPLIVLNV